MIAWNDFVGAQGGAVAEPVAERIWRLSEPALAADCRSFFYLLDMPEALVLIDGGWGLVRSRIDLLGGGARSQDGRPLVAIATHSHSDHIGALHLAQRRYGHPVEAAVYADPQPYATQARPWIDTLDFAADGSRIDPATYRQLPCPLTHPVADGDMLDFGGGALTVLHTPGHSPGSISLVHRRTGLLFCADTVHDGEIPGADRAALDMSHSRILDVDFLWACPGHGALMSREQVRARIARYRKERESPIGEADAGACS